MGCRFGFAAYFLKFVGKSNGELMSLIHTIEEKYRRDTILINVDPSSDAARAGQGSHAAFV